MSSKTPAFIIRVQDLARRGVFTPDECRSLNKAAVDLMAILLKMNVTNRDTILFPGTSAAWICIAFRLLRLESKTCRAVQLPFSGSKLRQRDPNGGRLSDKAIKDGWKTSVGGTGIFPTQGPTGRLFVVDFASTGETFNSLKTMFAAIWPETSGKMHLIQVRGAEYGKKTYATSDIVVNNALDNLTGNKSFAVKLSEADPYPRGCPVFGPNELGKDMGPYWRNLRLSKEYKECEEQLRIAARNFHTLFSGPMKKYAERKRKDTPPKGGNTSTPPKGKAAAVVAKPKTAT